MKKAEKDAAKDKGGFVGGQLTGGRRKRESVARNITIFLRSGKSQKMLQENTEAC